MKKYFLTHTMVPMFFLIFSLSSNVFAYNYGFDNITNNNAGDAAIGEAQLSFSVNEISSTQVELLFQNIGPEASSIADIYFDDDVPLMTWSAFSQMSGGVSFSEGANPGNLPGGGHAYSFSSDYSFDSDVPVQPNGINPGEVLGIVFDYSSGSGLDQIIAALNDGSMTVGIHVQGFDSGGSESFVSTTSTNPVPEPASMVLLGIGLLGIAGISRKKVLKR